MKDFEFRGLPWNVTFGAGAVQSLPQILAMSGLRKALILSTPGRLRHVEMLGSLLGDSVAGTFAGAAVHVPAGVVAEAGRAARGSGADCTVSIGGGSTTGLGKRLRMEAGLPQIAIPTTYAGSEMTPIWGVTEGNVKSTGRDPRVLPIAVIYDPELLVSLPPAIAGPSALNAMAQAIANVSTNPVVGLLAREAIRVLAQGLPRVMDHIDNVEAHAVMLYGSCLAGAALGLGRSGLHHRICHVLGGLYNLPHAETHAVILPYSVAHTARTAPEDAVLIAAALGVSDPAAHLYEWMRRSSTKQSLRALGLSESNVDKAAAAVANGGNTGYAADEVLRLLRCAFAGRPPGADR
ncbi:MAG: maleylacetate reductase [Gammaproteobacteria bacterium]|nr:maleylacetate reductase [Gammaproteobacteria bacterium]